LKVLILGSGGREHALAWKFSQSTRISGLFVAPGNAGTGEVATNLPNVNPLKPLEVVAACRENKIDIVFVGPEDPLSAGVIDVLSAEGIPAIGPHKEAARLEGSKAFSKKFMIKHSIPTADYREFSDFSDFEKYIKKNKSPIVLKKSGLAAGKGVLESQNKIEQLSFAKEVLKHDLLVVEEFLEGFETSIFAVCDGKDHILLPPCMDFKKAGEGNTGLNTGGMGSISPVPYIDAKIHDAIIREVVEPTFKGLTTENLTYRGIVYFGLMITSTGPKVLEYNVRLGDPETQSLLPLITSDFGGLCDAVVSGTIAAFPLEISDRSALGVVIAAKGYPGKYPKGTPVRIKEGHLDKDILIFHAATVKDSDGTIRTNGGRCFTSVGLGKDIFHATAKAYEGTEYIDFKGSWYRKDIGKMIVEPLS
jgi:phosphoribosylamine--glycine ligase